VPTYDQPTLEWTVVLRRQPVRIVEGQPEGGYTDAYGLICHSIRRACAPAGAVGLTCPIRGHSRILVRARLISA
jgi:hypothetical protein